VISASSSAMMASRSMCAALFGSGALKSTVSDRSLKLVGTVYC
jgi:hypothetical protein